MKKSILTLFALAALAANAQTIKHGHYSSNPVFTPSNNDIIVLTPGANIVKDSIVTNLVTVTALTYQLPETPTVGETVIINTGQAVANVKFTGGTLFKPITSTKKRQFIRLIYNIDGKWH